MIKIMKSLKLAFLLFTAVLCLSTQAAYSQAVPTASEGLHISTFGAATGAFTGLEGGKNLSITAGLDFQLRPFHGLFPTIEVRGTYPIDRGHIVSQKDLLGGLRIDHPVGRSRVYGNFLFGRGQLDYQNNGFTVGALTYLATTSNVYSTGGGIDFAIRPRLSFKADYQYQFWETPVTSSGSLHSSIVSLGVVYTFDFNHHYHQPRHSASTPQPTTRP
jgi:hypothetical protein